MNNILIEFLFLMKNSPLICSYFLDPAFLGPQFRQFSTRLDATDDLYVAFSTFSENFRSPETNFNREA